MPTMSSLPPPQTGPTISKGVEILLFASIIPALAIIFYITSRIIRNATKAKKPEDAKNSNPASLVEKILNSSTPSIETKSPELSHHSKKESRIQDLRRYFSPSQQAPSGSSSLPFKPFANHRCSISLKSSTPTSTSSRLRPLSLLSVIRKDNAKSKLAPRCPTHAPANPCSGPSSAHLDPISEVERLAMTRLSALADSIVGAHPDAEPLYTRSVKGHMVRSKDFRLVSASGAEIRWYTPADKGVAVVIPKIARGGSVKALASTSRIIKYEKDRQRYPNPSSNEKMTSSMIPLPRSSPTLDPVPDISSNISNVALAPTSTTRPLSVTSSSNPSFEPSPTRPSLLSGSISNASIAQVNLESHSPLLQASGLDFSQTEGAKTVHAHSVEMASRVAPIPIRRTKAAWDERVPGLVTITQIKNVSKQPSGASSAKERIIKAGRGRGQGLKIITNPSENNSQPESLACRTIGKKIPRSGHGRVVIPSRNTLNTRTKRLRDVKGRKLPQDGKENWQFAELRSALEHATAEKNGLLVEKQRIEEKLVNEVKRLEAELEAELEKRGILLTEQTEQTFRAASEAKNELSQRIIQLGEENAKLLTEIAKYKDALETMKTENGNSRDVVKGLEEESNNLRENGKKIEAENATLKEDVEKMRTELVSVEAQTRNHTAQIEEQMKKLTAENASLKTEIATTRAEIESSSSLPSKVAQIKAKSLHVKEEPQEHQLQANSNVIHVQEGNEIEELKEDLQFAIERLNAAEKRAGMYKQKYHEVVPELTALRNAASASGSGGPMAKDDRSQQAQRVVSAPAPAHIQTPDKTLPTNQSSEPLSTHSALVSNWSSASTVTTSFEAPSMTPSCVSPTAESSASHNIAISLPLPPPTITITKAIQVPVPVLSNLLASTSTSQSPPDLNLESDVDMEQSSEEEPTGTIPLARRRTPSTALIQELHKPIAHQEVGNEDGNKAGNEMSPLSVHDVLTSVSRLPGQKYQMVPVGFKTDNLRERLSKVISQTQGSWGLTLFLPGRLLKAGEHYVAVDPATQIIPNTQHRIKSQLEDYFDQTGRLFVVEGDFIYYAGSYKCFRIAQMPVEGFSYSDFEVNSLGLLVLANTCIPKPPVPGFPSDQMVNWIMNSTIRLNCIGLQCVGFEGELSRLLSSYHQQDISARKRKREEEEMRVREDQRERRRMSRSRSPIPPSRRPNIFFPHDRASSGDTFLNNNRPPNEERASGDEPDRRRFRSRSRSPPWSPPQHRIPRRQSPKPSLFLRLKDEPRWRYRN